MGGVVVHRALGITPLAAISRAWPWTPGNACCGAASGHGSARSGPVPPSPLPRAATRLREPKRATRRAGKPIKGDDGDEIDDEPRAEIVPGALLESVEPLAVRILRAVARSVSMRGHARVWRSGSWPRVQGFGTAPSANLGSRGRRDARRFSAKGLATAGADVHRLQRVRVGGTVVPRSWRGVSQRARGGRRGGGLLRQWRRGGGRQQGAGLRGGHDAGARAAWCVP